MARVSWQKKWLLLFIVSCFLPESLLQHQCTLCSDSPAQKWFVLAYKLAVVFRRRSAKTRVSRPDVWDIQGAEHALQVSGGFGPWRAIDGAYPNPYVPSSEPFTQLHTSGCFTLFFMILILEGMLVPSCRIYSSEPYIGLWLCLWDSHNLLDFSWGNTGYFSNSSREYL